jgi:AraC-like DNA-binding protein
MRQGLDRATAGPRPMKRLSKRRHAANGQAQRMRLRDDFFRRAIVARELLQPLDRIPGVIYYVKDAGSRLMAISVLGAKRMGFKNESDIIGLKPHEFMPRELADDYMAGDRHVIESGRPLLNTIEMGVNTQGVRDWIITDKYPLHDASGRVVGLVGITQSFDARRRFFAHLGPVGKAADYIRAHLGEPILLPDIAAHAGFSERQLQRLFRRVFGMTIHQFIIRSRIHASIQELTRSDRPIAEIAAIFGFSDQSAFTNRFREVTGVSPRAYRERFLEKLSPPEAT